MRKKTAAEARANTYGDLIAWARKKFVDDAEFLEVLHDPSRHHEDLLVDYAIDPSTGVSSHLVHAISV